MTNKKQLMSDATAGSIMDASKTEAKPKPDAPKAQKKVIKSRASAGKTQSNNNLSASNLSDGKSVGNAAGKESVSAQRNRVNTQGYLSTKAATRNIGHK